MINAKHNTNRGPATLPNGDPHHRLVDTFDEIQDADVSSVSYTPSDDDLRHLLHAMLLGHSFERYDRADYKRARTVSRRARSINPDDENWTRAQIAVCRANGLDPWSIHRQELEKNPTLDQHAVDHRRWPASFCQWIDNEPKGFEYHRAHSFFHSIYLADEAASAGDPRLEDDDSVDDLIDESTRRGIRIVTSLFGQEGFEDILVYTEVQDILRQTPANEFRNDGIFPNLSINSSRRGRPDVNAMRYYPIQRNWSKKVVQHLGDEELNNVLLSDLRKYTTVCSGRPFERGDFLSDFDGLDWRSDHRGKEPRF